ncbi:hypothetical protein C8Q72DRAFT_752873, partial [Fomitopsis betulina]
GNAFTGEYYARFVPTEDVACPCGTPFQTPRHIHSSRMSTQHPLATVNDVLGTQEGIRVLAKSSAKTGA